MFIGMSPSGRWVAPRQGLAISCEHIMSVQAPNPVTSEPRSKFRPRLVMVLGALLIAILAGVVFVRLLQAGPALVGVSDGIAVRRDASIVFFSGDTGLRRWSVGGRVAQQLARAGYSVTGVDTLAAFSQRQTLDQTTQLLERAIQRALDRNPGVPVVLVGQSFGSDLLPVAIDRLPPDVRGTINQIILIVPGTHAYLQVSLGEISGVAPPDVDLVPLARQLADIPLTCIYGVEETDSLCPVFRGPQARSIGLPGGHALHRDSDAVFAVVARALATSPGHGPEA